MNIINKLFKSFTFAIKGLHSAFISQLNFRIQCFAALLVITAGFILKLSSNEWLWLTINITLVLAAELINTAIEGIVDFISPGYHEKAGRIKDISAAAVTVFALNAIICGLIIFISRIRELFL